MREKRIAQSSFMVALIVQQFNNIISGNIINNCLIITFVVTVFMHTKEFRDVFISYTMGISIYFVVLSLLFTKPNGLLITSALFITWKIHVDLRYKSLTLYKTRKHRLQEFYFTTKLTVLFILMIYLVSGYDELQIIFVFLQQSILLIISKSNMAKKFRKILKNFEEFVTRFPNREFRINLADLDLGDKNLWLTVVISSISQIVTLFHFDSLDTVITFAVEVFS